MFRKGKQVYRRQYWVRNNLIDLGLLWDKRPVSRVCRLCKKEKQRAHFIKSYSENSGIYYDCKDCHKRKTTRASECRWLRDQGVSRKEAIRLFVLQHLKDHPCIDCGEADPIVLQFDHVRGEKEFEISRAGNTPFSEIGREIAKCEIRCANCHLRKTSVQQGWHKRKSFQAIESKKIVFSSIYLR